ncbi:PRC-barrel domain-containing protein [Actinoplanes solisilvae]|uniref:PRC-barrel domain-containing protein n=1 Tax=Actinoplanes solisilvae TaxID=2486853 RepID=UPI000FD88E01|nr:PRC-barrel domain-containing protein [Actinoplanes solisilvae]
MTRLSEIVGRPVVAAGTAVTVGSVTGVVVDPRQGAVVALLVKGASNGNTLHWPDMSGVGPDAVMVTSPYAVREAAGRAAEILGGKHDLVGKRLLTDTGDDLGAVTDIAFDEQAGTVAAIYTGDDSFPDARLVGCGSYAVVIRQP